MSPIEQQHAATIARLKSQAYDLAVEQQQQKHALQMQLQKACEAIAQCSALLGCQPDNLVEQLTARLQDE